MTHRGGSRETVRSESCRLFMSSVALLGRSTSAYETAFSDFKTHTFKAEQTATCQNRTCVKYNLDDILKLKDIHTDRSL
ncbi:unnamed protein product [Ixodes persulcatus]